MKAPRIISRKSVVSGFRFFILCVYCSVSIPGQAFADRHPGHPANPPHHDPDPAKDPGVRNKTVDAGLPYNTLSTDQTRFFDVGLESFTEVDSVSGTIPGEPDGGLGPRYNGISCVSCHSQPAVGGSSPSANAFPFIGPNPSIEAATHGGATNQIPYFISADGPVREARFKFFLDSRNKVTNTPDGGVHALYTITGRPDATNAIGISGSPQTCSLQQPDFNLHRDLNNISFRIPTPTFGAGLIENISENTILDNQTTNSNDKRRFGVMGRPNRNGNDGTITRFGWKAQNKSLEIFAGEAYNVEMGVSNELFQNERPSPGEILPSACFFNGTPESSIHFGVTLPEIVPSDATRFATFMRFLAPPVPSPNRPGGSRSISHGQDLFINKVQCALCHTPSLPTTASSLNPSLHFVSANLYSDLLLHHMGKNLNDGVSQGTAGPDEFRTAPLWGVGQRIFFLHDGRSTDLVDAILQHSSQGSEANAVIDTFQKLRVDDQQDLLNFLRSL